MDILISYAYYCSIVKGNIQVRSIPISSDHHSQNSTRHIFINKLLISKQKTAYFGCFLFSYMSNRLIDELMFCGGLTYQPLDCKNSFWRGNNNDLVRQVLVRQVLLINV